MGADMTVWSSVGHAQNWPRDHLSKDKKSKTGIVAGIRRGLAERGFIENQNVSIEYRRSVGEYRRLSELAALTRTKCPSRYIFAVSFATVDW
jgi:hypothetical protein